jgi:hypothetical protein
MTEVTVAKRFKRGNLTTEERITKMIESFLKKACQQYWIAVILPREN